MCIYISLIFVLLRIGINVASLATYVIDTLTQRQLMMDQMVKSIARHAMQLNLESEDMDLDKDQELQHLWV